ncbi:MAG: M48 family metallopeptidase [Bacteroidales bacterium]
MKYIGIQKQQSSNNFKTILLLLMFPVLILGLVFLFQYIMTNAQYPELGDAELLDATMQQFIEVVPMILIGVTIWFIIAFAFNSAMINSATGSKPLERKENMRIYNLVENLCMSQGMDMPKVNVINDNSLNAFASGINKKSYTVTLTTGIIRKLNDDELEGVIAHELSHIRNNDVRLMIVSIIFVGIFTFISQVAARSALYSSFAGRGNSRENNGAGAMVMMLIIAVLGAIGYFVSVLIRLAISRKREYMADASAAEMTKNPLALASALRKISQDSHVESVSREDVAQLFIEHPLKSGVSGLFATHPPIKERIRILEQF